MSVIVQRIMRSCIRLFVLALSIGIATLQHGKTTAQQIESARIATALEIVDLKTGNLEATLKNVMFEADSPDGEFLVTRDLMTGGFVLWKTRGGIELTELPTCHNPQFSPDGTLLAVAKPGIVELWDVADFLKVE